jgi:hypothetical protein
MQNFFDQRGPRVDTDSPSFRHLQELIRHAAPVHIELEGGESLQGTIQWQDSAFLAISQERDRPVVIVNRDKLVLLRVLV